MDPSSLIFVVIIGIWAVYLVQHWVRRREQLATSRSLDRFSGAMRVLERRPPIPVALPASTNRTYVVASTRVQASPARTLVAPAATSRTSQPEVAMQQTSTVPARATQVARPPRPVARPARPAARTVVPRRTHRVRALVLLTLLVATPAVWAAHLFGTLLLWPTLTVTALFVLDLLLVRSAVRRAAAQRRLAQRRTARGAARRPAARTFPVAARPVVAAGGSVAVQSVAVESVAVESVAVESVVVADGRPVHSQEAITEVIVLDGGWEPVAVPRPTYTMKAKAERLSIDVTALEADSDSAPSREPREPRESREQLVPAVAVDDFDLDAVLDRRRAAGE